MQRRHAAKDHQQAGRHDGRCATGQQPARRQAIGEVAADVAPRRRVILADTSAWIEYDRASGSPVDERVATLIVADGPLGHRRTGDHGSSHRGTQHGTRG